MFVSPLDPMCALKAGSLSVPVVAEPAEATRTKHLSFCIQYCNANKDWVIFKIQFFGVAFLDLILCSKNAKKYFAAAKWLVCEIDTLHAPEAQKWLTSPHQMEKQT